MPNYKESTVAGSTWTRSDSVIVRNPLNQMPSITFNEEEVFSLDGKFITRPKNNFPLGPLTETFADPSKTFVLVNPETDQTIGTATYEEMYVLLYSMYKALALTRDADAAAAAAV